MEHEHHHAPDHEHPGRGEPVSWTVSLSATLHCLTGCAIGEVLGIIIGTALGWSDGATVALAVGLAFFFGYTLTSIPLFRAGLTIRAVVSVAFAADTITIALMEAINNGIMVLVPGAMELPLTDLRFYGILTVALLIAGLVVWPINRWLISRGQGHAVVHAYH